MASLDEKQQYVSTFVFNVPNTNKHEPRISNIHETVKIHWRGTLDYGNLYLHFLCTHSVQLRRESNLVTVKIRAWSTHLSPNDTFKASFRRLCSEAITSDEMMDGNFIKNMILYKASFIIYLHCVLCVGIQSFYLFTLRWKVSYKGYHRNTFVWKILFMVR